VNTSQREGLPTTFIEAAAHRCAILSFTDPDGFASRFGRCVAEGELVPGLRALLEGNEWRARAEAGFRFVSATFATEKAMDEHMNAYARALVRRGRHGTGAGFGPDPIG
jgi:hypothetical protein